MKKRATLNSLLLLSATTFALGCDAGLGMREDPSMLGEGTGGESGNDGQLPGTSTGGTVSSPTEAECSTIGDDVGSNVLRRLSRTEYRLTVQDLFHLEEPPAIELIPEDVVKKGFSTFSEYQNLTASHLRAYWDTASALFDQVVARPGLFPEFLGCDPDAASCLRDFTTRFGRLAFRRDLAADEIDALVERAEEAGLDAEDRYRYVTESLLISPHFLFRVEVGDEPEGLSELSAEELAARLSFTLWGRGPSAELLDRAASGALDTDEGLEEVALGMLDDPKAEYFYTRFFREWLGYGRLRAPIEPPADWSDELMPVMMDETDALLAEYAWEPDQHFFDVLIANHTTVSPALARFYGVEADSTGHVEFAAGHPRAHAGLLGHAAILSQKTDGDKVSVRGNWLRHTFLCQELEIPAALAETLGEQLVGLTSMEIIEKRNVEPACRNCHAAIDPIGVGLARFDATGRFDADVDLADYPVEPGFPDAEDPSFDSLAELAEKLRAMPEITACLAESTFIYAQGRLPESLDACAFEASTTGFSEEGGSYRALLRNMVLSGPFRLRRAPSSASAQ